jgi:hypothetical protein
MFNVDHNMFDGPIPKSLKACTSVIQVLLGWNQLIGDISQGFSVHPHLQLMNLMSNRLTRELSPNWGACSNLAVLNVAENYITGAIPQSCQGYPN